MTEHLETSKFFKYTLRFLLVTTVERSGLVQPFYCSPMTRAKVLKLELSYRSNLEPSCDAIPHLVRYLNFVCYIAVKANKPISAW